MLADPRRAALAASVFTAATAAAFFLTGIAEWPLPLYLPLARRWVLARASDPPGPLGLGGLAMDFFGRSLLAIAAGGLALAIVVAVSRPRAKPAETTPSAKRPSDRLLLLSLAYAVTAVLLCSALFAYKLSGREISPVDLDPLGGGGGAAVENAIGVPR